MRFKIGIGLLLFGILLSNAGVDTGAYVFLAGLFVGFIGLIEVFAGASENTKNADNKKRIQDNSNADKED